MVSTLISFLLLSISLIGIGFFVELLINFKNKKALVLHTIAERGLVGIVGLSLIGMLIHFSLPLNGVILVLTHFFGISFFIFFLIKYKAKNTKENLIILSLLFCVTSVYLAYGLHESTPTYDTGLYHLQATLWNREHAISPGLANLHDRFGINSVWFVFSAALGLPKIWNSSLLMPNALLLVFVFVSSYEYFSVLKTRKKGMLFLTIFMMLQVVWAFPSVFSEINSISTDFPAMILTTYTIFLLYLRQSLDSRSDFFGFSLLLSLFAVLVKLSMLPLFLGILVWYFYENRKQIKTSVLSKLGLWVFIAFLGLSWLARGYILSGCILFPVEQTCISQAKWAVSPGVAKNTKDWISSWARRPGLIPSVVLADWGWLESWKESYGKSKFLFMNYQALVLFVSSIVYTFYSTKNFKHLREKLNEIIPIVLLLLSIYAYWFFSAPDPRFIAGAYVSLLLLLLLFFTSILLKNFKINISSDQLGFLVIVFLILKILDKQGTTKAEFQFPIWQRIPQAFQESVVNNFGQTFYMPVGGDDRCWAIELPCTPYFNPNLKYEQMGNRYFFFVGKN